MPVSGSNAPPFQFAPPLAPASWIVPSFAFGPSPITDGGVNGGPIT